MLYMKKVNKDSDSNNLGQQYRERAQKWLMTSEHSDKKEDTLEMRRANWLNDSVRKG